jgi:hypothetical protein
LTPVEKNVIVPAVKRIRGKLREEILGKYIHGQGK